NGGLEMRSWKCLPLPKRRDFIRTLAVLAGWGISTARFAMGQTAPSPPSPLVQPRNTLPKVGRRVSIGEGATDGPTWLLASRPLQIAWRQHGGDWIDANDVPNGPAAHAALRPASVDPPPIDVTSLVKKLQVDNTGILLHMASGRIPPAIMSRHSALRPRLSITSD